jgi:DNA polymerase-3 subunit epsilon
LSILFIDTETTGKAFFDLPSDDDRQPRMVQLAAVLSDPTGRVRGQLDVLILPEGWSVPVDATRVHGLTTDDCTAHGVRASSALKLLCEMAGDASKIVAHNIDFDAFILDGEFRRAGIQDVLPTEKYFCTMKAATDVCRLPGRRGFKWPSLAEAHRHLCGHDFDGAHDAMSDVRACMKVYFALQEMPAGRAAATLWT